jgi:hypothetical protein
MQRTAYHHNNQSLAVALHIAGFPIAHRERQYTIEEEGRFGLRARDCASKDLGGTQYFYHEWHEELPEMIAAYDEAAESDGLELDGEITPKHVVQIVAQALRARRDVAEGARNPDLAVIVQSKGEATVKRHPDGSVTLRSPGFVKVSDKDELREKAGVGR